MKKNTSDTEAGARTPKFETGVPGLDGVFTGLKTGDNVVWQTDSIEDYIYLAAAFARRSLENGRRTVYFRFAGHRELMPPDTEGLRTCRLDPLSGFESFASSVSAVIEEEGKGGCYIFDSLSELLSAWATDLMIGNFFKITCPRLYELETVAYFALMRNSHSHKSVARIRGITQILADTYRCGSELYIHPLKVQDRYSPTMFLPHLQEKNTFVPITDSVNSVRILTHIREKGGQQAARKLDYWDRIFIDAQSLAEEGREDPRARELSEKLCRLMVTDSPRMLSLAARHFSVKDLLEIKSRLIGTGFIGGKSAGMLLARKILEADGEVDFNSVSEPHDSFYIGSDIYHTYIIENGLWDLHMRQKSAEGYYEAAGELREKLRSGVFPDEISEQFQQLVEYFGSSPLIVRSSSLLEDGFGNAFAGKYESVFCANQGSPEERQEAFKDAVREVYSSAMSRDALAYRENRQLKTRPEQMALLVQRVSGERHKNYFFPAAGGVGFSYNSYVWNKSLSPEAGMLRIVFGLGTRAVDRVEGDYPRMVALDSPSLRPYSGAGELRKFSQHNVDVINFEKNSIETVSFTELMSETGYERADLVSERDREASETLSASGTPREYRILTLEGLIGKERFTEIFRALLKSLESAYEHPVEVEFTVNFTGEEEFGVNLLQCRPLKTRVPGEKVNIEGPAPGSRVFFSSRDNFIGGNSSIPVSSLVYINPKAYTGLSISDKYEVARITGRINRLIPSGVPGPVILIGPGRWGTSTPSLGISVNFYEINAFSALIETSFPEGGLMPEFSFGTHFFQDIVEAGILYAGLMKEEGAEGPYTGLLEKLPNLFSRVLPGYGKFENVIGIYDLSETGMRLISDIKSRKLLCIYGSQPDLEEV